MSPLRSKKRSPSKSHYISMLKREAAEVVLLAPHLSRPSSFPRKSDQLHIVRDDSDDMYDDTFIVATRNDVAFRYAYAALVRAFGEPSMSNQRGQYDFLTKNYRTSKRFY